MLIGEAVSQRAEAGERSGAEKAGGEALNFVSGISSLVYFKLLHGRKLTPHRLEKSGRSDRRNQCIWHVTPPLQWLFVR